MHTFSLGPSGAGKSYISEQLAAKDHLLFIEADIWPPQDGMVYHGLKPQWDVFHQHLDPTPLRAELESRAEKAKCAGSVLSFPGFPALFQQHIAAAQGVFRIVYFAGAPGQCLDSFLERERITGRGLTIAHWCEHVGDFFPFLAGGDVAANTILTFNAVGDHRSFDEIYGDIHRIT